ncbi:hypothetical protein [Epilithonimonas arachidiradicis]|uniref:Uncharacterized protein n=1 Tax=Epilithonimonas arachidiradicis TaxID=1617282 RepID=A0A420DB23_9FLAO|nr:hypothetical protein [Epilithonimonas arachidiradicis]RKE88169.1 hypothetical protein BXY58_1311 [Epilithonimonas arachidiradicis]GGG50808.1 hypothetical protein GCM10007332_10610 [Epilithonimonas arachidiradicis]
MTKIISEDSILNYLPIELDKYQLLIFDSIRITLQMIQNDFDLLEQLIEEIEDDSVNYQNDRIKAFGYVWGIIDKTHRLVKIYKKLPSKSKYKVLDKIKVVDKFRNTFQHLDERIDESLVKNKLPFYGTISWFYFENDEIKTKMIVSGIIYGLNVQFIYPDKKNYSKKINDITLHAVDRNSYISLNISSLINDIIELKDQNENLLTKIFIEKKWNLRDWTADRDIFITLKSEKE